MEFIESESEVGYYYSYRNEQGEKYVALEGLDPNQTHEPSAMEQFMLDHYSFFSLMYWGVLVATLVFLIGNFIVIPLYLRLKHGLPLFEEQ